MHFLHQFKDPDQLAHLLAHGGYLILFAVIFAETALLIGFFLPGDSLLFLSGLLATNPRYAEAGVSIGPLIIALALSAILGDTVGYLIGRQIGPPLFSRPNSKFFKREHLERAHAFYEKYGGKAIVLARFVFVVRTFVPTIAGAAEMDFKKFMTYNLTGGVAWVSIMCLLGYFMGNVPILQKHIDLVTLGIVFLSVIPVGLHVLQEKKAATAAKA